MSTEHQQYSTENQADRIKEYAERHGIDIVHTYADEGKSGLNIGGREGLQRLLEDVRTRRVDFEFILVYDVSRWGRFQDADESAYYEFLCKQAGLKVIYCAEQFDNDGSPVATIVKGVKRAMAGEYSRELSAKVFAGQCRLIELGYRQGGTAGFGLRRVLLDQSGEAKGELRRGEQKSLRTDRVVLRPGPADEVSIVQDIYRAFVEQGHNEATIARRLNEDGVLTDLVEASRLRVLAVTASQRQVLLPDIPTTAEAGAPGFEAESWHMLTAPRGTPQAVMDRLEGALRVALAEPALIEAMVQQGVGHRFRGQREAAAFFAAEHERWTRVTREGNITAD